MKVKVKERQTLADIALQERGEWTAAWELARENGMSLTEELADGLEVEVAEQSLSGAAVRVVAKYVSAGVEPASGLEEDFGGCGGIGRMCVGRDFEIIAVR